MNRNKLGRFRISNHILKDESCHESLMKLMGKMIIVEATQKWSIDGIEYVAIFDGFECIKQGDIIPLYSIDLMSQGILATRISK